MRKYVWRTFRGKLTRAYRKNNLFEAILTIMSKAMDDIKKEGFFLNDAEDEALIEDMHKFCDTLAQKGGKENYKGFNVQNND